MSLRRRLSIQVAIGLTPLFLLTVVNAARWQIYLENKARSNAVSDARLFSSELGGMIDNSHQLLLAMSKFPVTSSNDAECAAFFKSVIASLPMYQEAAVIDAEGRLHCSTTPIAQNRDVRDRLYFRDPLTTGKFTINTHTEDGATAATSIQLSMPYRSADGSLSGVIVLGLNPETMADSLAGLSWRLHGAVVVVDHRGSMVFAFPRNRNEDAEAIAKAVRANPTSSATVDVNLLPNRPQIVASAPVGENGFTVLLAEDRNIAVNEGWQITARRLAVGIAALVLGIGGVWIATHFFIVRPIRTLIRVARRRERGDPAARFPIFGQMTEFGDLSLALSRMSAKVDELLAQNAMLLRELQHRVMNSLNLLSSIFDMQSRHRLTTDTSREQLASARNRVVAMGTVYRHLYNSDTVDAIDISALLRIVCNESKNAYEGPVKLCIQVDATPLLLSGTNATALAMLTHELITNAVKHAYSEGDSAPISVSLKRLDGGSFEYRFRDRGRGLPGDFEVDKSDSLGMLMISATTHQLGGKLTINHVNPGTEFLIELPPEIEQSKAT
jgi:two-component sensor histidine kinase